MSESPLREKIVLVTGASRGIGRALAIACAEAGAEVICTARSATGLDATVSAIVGDGGHACALPCDATDENSVRRLFAAISQQHERLDVVCINAGGTPTPETSIETSTYADWKLTVETNLSTAFLIARGAIPFLRRSINAKIITTGSGLGRRPRVASSAYSCGKSALWSLTQSLALELADDGIAVNELIPGPVSDEATTPPQTIADGALAGEPLKTPQEVVPLALFLATQPPHGPTGQSFALNRRLL